MFGDMEELGRRSTELRSLASTCRQDAQRLVAKVSLLWESTAASAYARKLDDHARDFRTAANSLVEAAAAIDAHIAAVAEVRRQIADAEQWIGARWNDATHLVRSVMESVEDTAAGVFEFFGQKVPAALVHESKDIVHSIRSLPSAGSPEWLDLAATFRRNGWTR